MGIVEMANDLTNDFMLPPRHRREAGLIEACYSGFWSRCSLLVSCPQRAHLARRDEYPLAEREEYF